ncbi:hypothetical protein [Flagellimonas allohymeniacidonis]|uniref:Uncharacterized protein n=1 Tax=Flagellimonas allohymeniacidonis TaxID=2517819 RepID=A0A4Q8QDG1_9FLAO|nr:hypothetical protein [Allomuricauda hymeniacidonis]TAI48435.1 hypothetical protein EW142_01115 [Allomuricauda hymeniacidonis]
MWWLLASVLIVLCIVYLLFVPVILYIDTQNNSYFVRLKGLVKASVLADEEEIIKVHFQMGLIHFNLYPLRKRSKKRKKKKEIKKVESKPSKHFPLSYRKAKRLLKSFKLKKIYLDLDTGDFTLNAKLYPVFAFLNHYYGRFHINFQGKNRMVLCLQNRPINIIKVFINS